MWCSAWWKNPQKNSLHQIPILLWRLNHVQTSFSFRTILKTFLRHHCRWKRTSTMHLRRMALWANSNNSTVPVYTCSASVSASSASSNWHCRSRSLGWGRRHPFGDVDPIRRTYPTCYWTYSGFKATNTEKSSKKRSIQHRRMHQASEKPVEPHLSPENVLDLLLIGFVSLRPFPLISS